MADAGVEVVHEAIDGVDQIAPIVGADAFGELAG
jgi:hypothetical protein